MRIHRIKHDRYFTVLGNDLLRRHALSFCARGLLAYLISLPDASREDVRTLAAKSKEGRVSIANALDELERAGYYVRRTARDPLTGRVSTTVDVYEVPTSGKAAHTVPPLPASLAAGRPGAGRPGTGKAGSNCLSTAKSKTDEVRPSVRPAVPEPAVREDVTAPLAEIEPEPLFWEEPGDVDLDEAREAYAAFSGLLGGTDGSFPANEPEGPSEPHQSPPSAAQRTTRPGRTSEGVELLMELGRRQPEMALSGKPLADQGAMVEGLLAAGWTWTVLMSTIGAPLPTKITTSVAAVLARRIQLIPVNPPVRQDSDAPKPAGPRPVRHDCTDCRAPGQSRPGLCPKCRGDESKRVPAPATEPGSAMAAAMDAARAARGQGTWGK